ncbi:hypothetical protein ASE36_14935, partial [Rhizobium sp. Root274]
EVFSKTKDFVASSAAALVSERMYRFHLSEGQQLFSEKMRKSDKALNFHVLFRVLGFWQLRTLFDGGH